MGSTQILQQSGNLAGAYSLNEGQARCRRTEEGKSGRTEQVLLVRVLCVCFLDKALLPFTTSFVFLMCGSCLSEAKVVVPNSAFRGLEPAKASLVRERERERERERARERRGGLLLWGGAMRAEREREREAAGQRGRGFPLVSRG